MAKASALPGSVAVVESVGGFVSSETSAARAGVGEGVAVSGAPSTIASNGDAAAESVAAGRRPSGLVWSRMVSLCNLRHCFPQPLCLVGLYPAL